MITLNPDQIPAEKLLQDKHARFICLYGNTGGGKTFVIGKNTLDRAIHAPGSSHLCLRSTLNDAKSILFQDNFRKVVNKYFDVSSNEDAWDVMRDKKLISLDPLCIRLENGSRIDFKGLDENRVDRVLGSDYSTIYISEASLIDDYSIITTLNTRLREQVNAINGKQLKMRFLFDLNPCSKRHWTYPTFYLGENNNTRLPHADPRLYASISLDQEANRANMSDGYIESLHADMAGDYIRRKRFLEGMWYDEVENALFSGEDITRYRLSPITPQDSEATDFTRIIVAIDPAMSNHKGSDETGIMVLAEDEDRGIHVLEDLSGKYQPIEWGTIAVNALERWKGNEIIAEKNQGGNLVESNIATVNRNVRVTLIHASKGKDIRAEASSTAYKQGRVHHRGIHQKLEDQLVEFEVGFNRKKKGYSPDRLDALVHGVNHLLGETKSRGGRQESFDLFG